MNGGYDEGYSQCKCFWGTKPGSLINILDTYVKDYSGLRILDAGCGEGKNSIYFAERGANVLAIDVSAKAIENAIDNWPNYNLVKWIVSDITLHDFKGEQFDLVVAYGVLHCLHNRKSISDAINIFQTLTATGGYNVICAFNDRFQDLSAHPGFSPTLLKHSEYIRFYNSWKVLHCTDLDLTDKHPHNNIVHTHSLTRLVARK